MKLLKLSFVLILIGSALLLSGVSKSAHSKSSPASQEIRSDKHKDAPKEVKDTAENQAKPTLPTAFEKSLIETLRAINDQIETASEQYDTSQKSWNSPSMWIQIALVVVAIGYTFFAACQWWATRKLTDLERPWIMIEADWPNSSGQGIPGFNQIKWSAINIGKSPAFVIRIDVKPDIIEYPLPASRPTYPNTGSLPKFILGPDKRHTHIDLFPIDATQGRELFSGNRCVVFYGIIEYLDTSNCPHRTRFCCYWHLENGQWLYEPVGPPDWVEYT